MKKQFRIQLFSDGQIQAEVLGVKGKKCTDYISLLEELLDAETIDSEYTAEYYESEKVEIEETEWDYERRITREEL
ncbi:hypothetical protein A8F94_08315 [Bacillus sp. FJAT-27225]|uniref:DUF2997 domain-containing protein n=1 Tax=Bacillus sp. FJAT-27225 TaxID=1743144 RepID=UPI00080C2802|nr:DUF2997 domain-containing protein [Bacillus sp. FJAT-27225]OCA87835.1 hypothetical protein A8F94_08315 [Bacillus sp. FJAT-27225]